ncbi:hypothetical protein VTK26DRAFT_5020 [Humicola hyalothermophila]
MGCINHVIRVIQSSSFLSIQVTTLVYSNSELARCTYHRKRNNQNPPSHIPSARNLRIRMFLSPGARSTPISTVMMNKTATASNRPQLTTTPPVSITESHRARKRASIAPPHAQREQGNKNASLPRGDRKPYGYRYLINIQIHPSRTNGTTSKGISQR